MERRTRVAGDITLAQEQALYDASCKRLLSYKIFLAWILKYCLDEYQDCDVTTIAEKYIEGIPSVGETGVDPDQSNRQVTEGASIAGMNTEDTLVTEGRVNYDIRFHALAPQDGALMRIIVNVEAQNRYNPGYPLIKRGIYYASRLISAQHGREFERSEYGKIRKVCSIWICLNADAEKRNSITRYALKEEHLVGRNEEPVANYDLISVVMICLGKAEESEEASLLRMLDVLLSNDRKAEEKIAILSEEFAIAMSEPMEEEVAQMCNLSQGIVEKGLAEGLAKGMEQGMAKGMEQGLAKGMEQGMAKGIFDANMGSIRAMVSELHLTVEQAMNVLKIPQNERERYKAALDVQARKPRL